VEGISWLTDDRLVMVSDRAEGKIPARAKERSLHVFRLPSSTASASAACCAPTRVVPAVLGLFQRRIHGDDALLRLARRRFLEAGIGAEVYAHAEEDLRRVLPFVPAATRLPVVHLDRQLDLSDGDDVECVVAFAEHFAGHVSGLVVHDQRDMANHTDRLVDALERLDQRLAHVASCPSIFLEYAAGHPVEWFAGLGERLRSLEVVSLAIDVGHIGIRQARRAFKHAHPDLELTSITPLDPRLPDLIGDVVDAVASAQPVLLDLIGALGAVDRPLHFHLHDGHPLVEGLEDHRSFLLRVPIPFPHDGRRSLPPLYGPAGLAAIVTTARRSCTAPVSFTLEIHEDDGRLPLHDADEFRHWRDLTNAERMNAWLRTITENAELVQLALRGDGLR
jgi:hypothetical protein